MKRRGITLLELLISIALTVVIVVAVFRAYSAAIRVGPALEAGDTLIQQRAYFQQRITDLLHHAYVLNNGATIVATATGQRTYFTTNPTAGANGVTQTAGGSATQSGGSSGNGSQLVFTTLGMPTNQAALNDPSNDFNLQNQARGPQGGVGEYSFSLTPVGNAAGQTGIFIREQVPADTDATQGGYESLILPKVDSLTFEFFDGLQWQQSWDTTTQTPIRLPSAVRVTYSTGSETPHVFVVQIPSSDVTPLNPATNIGNGAPQ